MANIKTLQTNTIVKLQKKPRMLRLKLVNTKKAWHGLITFDQMT